MTSPKNRPPTPTPEITEPEEEETGLSTGELCALLGVQPTSLKKALRKGNKKFEQYCYQKCGKKFEAIDISKPDAKIPRWEFRELKQTNKLTD